MNPKIQIQQLKSFAKRILREFVQKIQMASEFFWNFSRILQGYLLSSAPMKKKFRPQQQLPISGRIFVTSRWQLNFAHKSIKVSITFLTLQLRNHQFRTSANFTRFVTRPLPAPPSIGIFLLRSVGKFLQNLTPPSKLLTF